MHFIDEDNIINYVDFECGITYYNEAPQKSQKKRSRNIHPYPVATPSSLQKTLNITVLWLRILPPTSLHLSETLQLLEHGSGSFLSPNHTPNKECRTIQCF